MGPTSDFDIALRAQIVTLRALGWKNDEVASKLGVSNRVVTTWFSRAKQRGFDPNVSF